MFEEKKTQVRTYNPLVRVSLKVPKCEIFDRLDFHDFYTIKSLWAGDLNKKYLKGPYAYAQPDFKDNFFLEFGKKSIFLLLRPFVSV